MPTTRQGTGQDQATRPFLCKALYEVVVPGANDLGTVWMLPGQDAGDGMIVEARLVVLRRQAWRVPSGEVVPAFTEFRLMDVARPGR